MASLRHYTTRTVHSQRFQYRALRAVLWFLVLLMLAVAFSKFLSL
jgi:hypothetical protein